MAVPMVENKRKGKNFEELNSYLSYIVECTQDAITSVDLEGVVKSWNRGAENLLGYRASEILGRHYHIIVPEELRGEIEEKRREALKEACVRFETLRLHKDGSKIPVDLTISVVKDREGRVIGTTGMMKDISERKKLEEELKERTEELESFAYSVAHDLKTPIRAIQGFSDALVEDYRETLDQTARHYLERITAGTRKMNALIEDLLEYSKLERQPQMYESVELSEVVESVVEDLEVEKKAELVVGELPTLYCHRTRIAQLFANLIENSLRFTGEKARIEIGCRGRGKFYELYVRDNGVGFNSKYSAKIFELFYRLNPREYGGTGVGLAIVKKIVENHGGKVWAESEKGKGSTFYFSLPARS